VAYTPNPTWVENVSAITAAKAQKWDDGLVNQDGRLTALETGMGAVIYAEDYGAVGNGTTDDTVAIQSALNAAAAPVVRGGVGKVVQLKAKKYLTGPLTMTHSSTLQGVSRGATTLLLKANSTAACLTFGPHTNVATIRHLRIDGNKYNQTSTAAHGIEFPTSAANFDSTLDEYNDPRNSVDYVHIENTKGDGLRHRGRGANQISNLWCWLCDGNGVYAGGIDSYFTNIDVGVAGLDGFYISGADLTFTNTKAWYCGAVSTAGNAGSGYQIATFGGLKGSSMAAQDNARAGFYLKDCGNLTLSGIDADSNNTAGFGHAGIDLNNCYTANIFGFSWERNAADRQPTSAFQQYGVRVLNGSANNRITVNGGGNTLGILDPSSLLSGNSYTLRPVANTGQLHRVVHDGTSYAARPPGVAAGFVDWVGPTQPTAWLDGDTWTQTA